MTETTNKQPIVIIGGGVVGLGRRRASVDEEHRLTAAAVHYAHT